MKKFKIVLSVLLSFTLLLGNSFAFAATSEDKDFIVKTQYFFPNNTENGGSKEPGFSTRGIVYPIGTIKIDDVLGATSGKYLADTESAILSTILSKTLDLIQGIPVVGTIYTTGKEVLDWTLAVNSDISNIDYTKSATLTTYYSFRNFTHQIYAYNSSNQWQDVGNSLSRYYYKHTFSMVYDKTRGDFVSAVADYSYSEGYGPTYTAKAPNYTNYSNLSKYGNECFLTGRYYRENYY